MGHMGCLGFLVGTEYILGIRSLLVILLANETLRVEINKIFLFLHSAYRSRREI
jgi:hypothetical protein